MTAATVRFSFASVAFGALLAALVLSLPIAAGAQAASGTVSGRLLWSSCMRIPLPAAVAPDAADVQPVPPPSDSPGPSMVRPTPIRSLPAGAVLVAVQNTSLSTRSDEGGKFTLSGVPTGQYLTVAAGPVANAAAATVTRPNVFVDGGQSVDLGNLVLGASGINLLCGAVGVAEGEAMPAPDTAPGSP